MSKDNRPAVFFAALEANPADTVTTLKLANWYDEQGEPDRAACLRWVVATGHHPYRYKQDGSLTVFSECGDLPV
jgi:uncharacterized protein (TIGR02996 family)